MPRPVVSGRMALAALLVVTGVPGLVACTTGDGPGGASSSTPATWPAASGPLSTDQGRAVFDRAAAALQAQRTMAVNYVVERVDGYCVNQVLNPTVRLDLRDPARPVAALALSILASNVAVGGKVYRQQADPTGNSTVWVSDPEPKTPLEFVLFKPGATTLTELGTEDVAGKPTRHYRSYDPDLYGGPTARTGSGTPTASAPVTGSTTSTTCRPQPTTSSGAASSGQSTGPSTGETTRQTTGPSTGPGTSPTTPGGGTVGDYDDLWLADDGTPLRFVSVMGDLRLTSNRIAYGGEVSVDVPDVSKAISQNEYDRRRASATSSATG